MAYCPGLNEKGISKVQIAVWLNPERRIFYSSDGHPNLVLGERSNELEDVAATVAALKREGIAVKVDETETVRQRFAAKPGDSEPLQIYAANTVSRIVPLTLEEKAAIGCD